MDEWVDVRRGAGIEEEIHYRAWAHATMDAIGQLESRGTGGVIQSSSESLRIRGLLALRPSLNLKPRIQDCPYPGTGKDGRLSSSREQICPSFPFSFSLAPWTGRSPPSLGGPCALLSSLIQMFIWTPLPNTPEVTFYLLSKHPLL